MSICTSRVGVVPVGVPVTFTMRPRSVAPSQVIAPLLPDAEIVVLAVPALDRFHSTREIGWYIDMRPPRAVEEGQANQAAKCDSETSAAKQQRQTGWRGSRG